MSDLGLLALGFLMLVGQIIMLLLWQAGWFKKERFKIEKSNIMAQNKLQLRKMERDLGLGKSKNIQPAEKPGLLDTVGGLLPVLKNLEADQIGQLIELLSGGGFAEREELSGLDSLMGFAEKNPEIVKGFLEGLTKPKNTNQSGQQYES